MMKGIIPHRKGTDICSDGKYHYIIRSDLGCYMRTTDVKEGSDISIFSLHPSCQNGDHYLVGPRPNLLDFIFKIFNLQTRSCATAVTTYNADECHRNCCFFIIKGNSFRRVTNLTTDSDATKYSLHPNCQGGDHYFCHNLPPSERQVSSFCIIFQKKGTYRVTTNLHLDSNGEEHELNPSCKDGLYYWGIPNRCFFLMPVSDWGVEFCTIVSISTNQHLSDYSVHPDVLNFLPGGLSVTQGPASGVWEIIKSITNDSTTPVTWQKRINKKVGHNKEKMSQITHNWNMAMSSSVENGKLSGLITKFHFSFSAEYGGSHVSTDTESWNEATEVEEQLTFELKPNESLYLWQYRLKLGEDPVLFCRDLKISNKPNPPTEVPLSVTQ